MSGGVPKRISISRTQRNTPSKAGRWGKPGIILCNGARSRRAMCNSIQTRAKYCPTPCVQKKKEGTTNFFTLKVGLDDTSTGPPDAGSAPGGTGSGFVGASVEFGYGAWDPPSLPGTQGLNTLASGGAPNPLGQVFAAEAGVGANSICYNYDNDTGNNFFIIEAFNPFTTPSGGVVPFTSITLTKDDNQSITYNYGAGNATDVYSRMWAPTSIPDPNFQFWTDAYNANFFNLNIVVNY